MTDFLVASFSPKSSVAPQNLIWKDWLLVQVSCVSQVTQECGQSYFVSQTFAGKAFERAENFFLLKLKNELSWFWGLVELVLLTIYFDGRTQIQPKPGVPKLSRIVNRARLNNLPYAQQEFEAKFTALKAWLISGV